MSIVTNLTSAWKFGDGLLKVVCGLAIGFLLCLVTCGKGSHTTEYTSGGTDTVWIDTSKIITYTPPAQVREVMIHDTVDRLHDCWGHVPMSAVGNDSLFIDSANSCKGIYKGIRITHKQDTIHDTTRIAVSPPVLVVPMTFTNKLFGFEASVGAGPCIGASFAADVEARVWYDSWMLEVRPQVFVQDKLRTFASATIRYKF